MEIRNDVTLNVKDLTKNQIFIEYSIKQWGENSGLLIYDSKFSVVCNKKDMDEIIDKVKNLADKNFKEK